MSKNAISLCYSKTMYVETCLFQNLISPILMKKEIYEVFEWQQIKELTGENLVGWKRLGCLLLMPIKTMYIYCTINVLLLSEVWKWIFCIFQRLVLEQTHKLTV